MVLYILLGIIVAVLVYFNVRILDALEDVQDKLYDVLMDIETDSSYIPHSSAEQKPAEEETQKAAEIEKQYTEGLMNILNYSADSRRKKAK